MSTRVERIAVVLCGRCESSLVDVVRWTSPTTAWLRCASCHQESPVEWFTIGRVYGLSDDVVAQVVTEARRDRARPRAVVP
jgi:hypothetical protein